MTICAICAKEIPNRRSTISISCNGNGCKNVIHLACFPDKVFSPHDYLAMKQCNKVVTFKCNDCKSLIREKVGPAKKRGRPPKNNNAIVPETDEAGQAVRLLTDIPAAVLMDHGPPAPAKKRGRPPKNKNIVVAETDEADRAVCLPIDTPAAVLVDNGPPEKRPRLNLGPLSSSTNDGWIHLPVLPTNENQSSADTPISIHGPNIFAITPDEIPLGPIQEELNGNTSSRCDILSPIRDPSIAERPVLQDVAENCVPHWEIKEKAGRRLSRVLFDGLGHAMSVKNERKKDGAIIWRCVKRTVPNACKSLVCQQGNHFQLLIEHTCDVDKDLLTKREMNAKARLEGMANKFLSAPRIAEPVINQAFKSNPVLELPKIPTLSRCVNRARSKIRPPNPVDLFFTPVESALPEEFWRGEVLVTDGSNQKRHLLFSSASQLAILKNAKKWSVDATFRLVKLPFTQMFSINCFLRKGENEKLVPVIVIINL